MFIILNSQFSIFNLFLYSQQQDNVFDLTYACHEATKQYQDDVHDVESGIITIKSKDTGWDDEYTQMTQFHSPILPAMPKGMKIPTGPELK